MESMIFGFGNMYMSVPFCSTFNDGVRAFLVQWSKYVRATCDI